MWFEQTRNIGEEEGGREFENKLLCKCHHGWCTKGTEVQSSSLVEISLFAEFNQAQYRTRSCQESLWLVAVSIHKQTCCMGCGFWLSLAMPSLDHF